MRTKWRKDRRTWPRQRQRPSTNLDVRTATSVETWRSGSRAPVPGRRHVVRFTRESAQHRPTSRTSFPTSAGLPADHVFEYPKGSVPMGVRRRTVLASALAGSAVAALSAAELRRAAGAARPAASPAGDGVGKITVGYQGWFACAGVGAPINAWLHRSNGWSQPPSPTNNVINAWPD